MKRKRCFKTILSSLLAAAMLVTAAPADSLLMVSAAQVETLESETTPVSEIGNVPEVTPETEVTAENETQTESTTPENGESTTGETTESTSSEESTGTEDETLTGGETVDSNAGNNTTNVAVNGKQVTFTFVPTTNDFAYWDKADVFLETANISKIFIKGAHESTADWTNLLDLTKVDDTGVWSGTATFKAGKYDYNFFAYNVDNKEHYCKTYSNTNFVIDGIVDASLNAVKGKELSLDAALHAYENGTETTKNVAYSLEGSPANVTLEGAAGSQKLTVAKEFEGESVVLTATDTGDANNTAKITVQLVTALPDPDLQSPVVGKGQATFYYFAPKPQYQLVKIKGEMTGQSWPTVDMEYNEETGYWSKTLKMAPGKYEYGFEVYAKDADLAQTGAWSTDPLNTTDGKSYVEVTEAGDVSPQVDGKQVKFIYENNEAAAVYVAGSMSGWGDAVKSDEYKMTKNEETGYWELTKEMAPGKYQYKYIWLAEGSTELNWVNDPLNPNQESGNNILIVAGLADAKAEVARQGITSVKLPASLDLYGDDGTAQKTAVTYTLSKETNEAAYKDKITITKENDGSSTLTLAEGFPEDVESFTLTAADASEHTSVVTIDVVDKKYKYTVYYYDEEHKNDDKPEEAAALWIWTEGADGTLYNFTGTETDTNGNTWLKAELELSFTDLRIIPRNSGDPDTWKWQDSTRKYNNKTGAEESEIYIIFDDGYNVYTEAPERVQIPKRYFVVEYEKQSGGFDSTFETDGAWYLYSWNTGYGDGVYAEFDQSTESVSGNNVTRTASLRVRRGLESLSYILADLKPVKKDDGSIEGYEWGPKDGGDRLSTMPADQYVVKVKVNADGTTVYPYNTGYEMAPEEGVIHFYYRDDEEFRVGSTGSKTVELEYGTEGADGALTTQTKSMSFDAETQRYTCDLSVDFTKDAVYYYRYKVGSEYVIDYFNTEPVKSFNDVKYSVCAYEKLDLEVSASMQNPSMDYNDNNVLSISLKIKGSDQTAEEEKQPVKVSKATVDLTSVGGTVTQIDPELLQISIAVTENTAAGTKTLPIVVYDIYNNKYETSATVNVIPRTKNSDFDWDEAVIYFAVTDRFFDGNTKNNGVGYDDSETGSSSYHGGDFAGLTQKLDYLQDLGVNTIWITPIVENQTEPNDDKDVGASWGYHGYWAKNFEKIDSHLGTEAEFKALLDAAHARGMKIMVDVVLNHSGYKDVDYFNSQLKDENGDPIRMIREDEEMITGHDQKSSLAGLPDFLTENKEVRDLLVEWQSKWISKYDIDYYRVDTVKHVDSTTWTAFKNALTMIDPEFKMIGEWAGAGYGTDTGALRSGQMDALLDFDFNNQATEFVKGNIASVESFMTARNAAIDNTATLGAFLGSHDEDGFVYHLINGEKIAEPEAYNLALVAASLQLTAKGQAVIYYGEEIGMTGANNYPWQTNRYDFDWSEVNADNATLAHYKAMLAIRNKYSEVLAKGDRVTINADDTNGLDVFSRSYNGTTLRVALNITDEQQAYELTGLTPGTVFYDYYATYRNGARKHYVVDSDGKVTITIPAAADGGTVVLAAVAPDSDFVVDGATLQEGFDVRPIADKAYTGKNIILSEEELVVYYDGKPLQIKKDYTASYKNNKTPGTATITIKGKGNYAGSVTTEFTITKKNINDTDIVLDYKDLVANNKAQKPLTKITNGGVKLGAKDYTVKYYLLYKNGSRAGSALSSVKGAGTYEMVVTGTGSYTGTRTETFKVVAGGVYMNKTAITLKQTDGSTIPKAGIPYIGTPITVKVLVTDKNIKGTDKTVPEDCYIVEYSNNTEVGTATVKIKGIPAKGYCGEVTKTFKIAGVKLSSVAEVDTSKWENNVTLVYDPDTQTAAAVQPKANEGLLKAKANAPAITQDDYEVTYAKNDKPGTATVTFTGKRKYTGTIKKTFKVTAIDLTGLTNDAQNADGTYYTIEASTPYRTGKAGAKAMVTVNYKGALLEENKDYTLTYSANKAVSTATSKAKVKITGKGAFTGKIENIAFDVTQVDLADLPADISLTAPDAVYTNKAGKYMTVPVLDGTKLTSKNYDLKYFVWENNDWALKDKQYKASTGDRVKIEITPKSAAALKTYTGTGSVEYKVVQANISKAKVTIKAQEYTGKAITLGKSDFSSVKVGNDKLVLGNDFEIVEGSYTNNINKGTASVTIKGIGNYTGEKKVTFKITSRFMTWWWNLFR